MAEFYIQRAFQIVLTRPNPSKNEEVRPRQVGEEKLFAVKKLGRNQEIVLQPGNLVATRKLGHD